MVQKIHLRWYRWYKSWYIESEAILIKLSEYFKAVYPVMDNQKNQGLFVTRCFQSAGSNHFALSTWKQTSSDLETQRMLYKGNRKLTADMRASFPRPIDSVGLSEFFLKNISSNNLRKAMTMFAIPPTAEENCKAFTRSLSSQFGLFVSNDTDNVDDIVAMEYQRFLSEPDDVPIPQFTPLYPNDSAYVSFQPQMTYSTTAHGKFQHTWSIQNDGKQTWRGRKLVFSNRTEVRPRADTDTLDIPDTPPGESIKITTDFNARGFEGKWDCIWEMQDCDGNNCFPNNKRLFCITVIAKFECK